MSQSDRDRILVVTSKRGELRGIGLLLTAHSSTDHSADRWPLVHKLLLMMLRLAGDKLEALPKMNRMGMPMAGGDPAQGKIRSTSHSQGVLARVMSRMKDQQRLVFGVGLHTWKCGTFSSETTQSPQEDLHVCISGIDRLRRRSAEE